MEIVIVAAMTEEGVIGKDNDLPWRLPADWKHFKQTTVGHVVLMGRRTFESLDGPLKDRQMLILTGQKDYQVEGCEVFGSLQAGLERAEELAETVMIGGGASVYEQVLPMADRLSVTVIHKKYEGDAYFPGINPEEWRRASARFREADEKNEAAMTFLELEKKADAPREVRSPGEGFSDFYSFRDEG